MKMPKGLLMSPLKPPFEQITENDAKSLSKAPCLVALRMYLTLHLLLFRQSM